MNRTRKCLASSVIVVLTLLAFTCKPQASPSSSASGPNAPIAKKTVKGFTDGDTDRHKKGKAAPIGSSLTTPSSDSGERDLTNPPLKAQPVESKSPSASSIMQPATQSQAPVIEANEAQHANVLDSLSRQLRTAEVLTVIGLVLGATALIVVAGIIFFQIQPLWGLSKATERQYESLRADYKQLKDDLWELKLKNRNLVTGDRFEGLETVVNRLEERIKASRPRTFAGDGPPTQPCPPQPNIQQIPQTSAIFAAVASAPARVTTFYADLPDRDGCFKDLKDKVEWNSLYQLTLEGSDNATVEIFSGSDRFEAALKAAQQYLSPVCEYQSNPPSSAKKINQMSPGKAVREGSGWRVKQKLKIEFV